MQFGSLVGKEGLMLNKCMSALGLFVHTCYIVAGMLVLLKVIKLVDTTNEFIFTLVGIGVVSYLVLLCCCLIKATRETK